MKLNKQISSIAISAAVAGILTGCAELGMENLISLMTTTNAWCKTQSTRTMIV